MITIRSIQEADAQAFLTLSLRLDQETQFMMLEPGERTTTLEEQRERIRSVLASDNQTIFVAQDGEQLVGYLAALGEGYRRSRHSAYIVAGVLQAYAGQGLGKRLFSELDLWAGLHPIHRLELTVMVHNQRALHLYQKIGFTIEGTKRHSLRVNEAYVDEYYMAKLLE